MGKRLSMKQAGLFGLLPAVFAALVLAGCASVGHKRVAFIRVVSTHIKFTERELVGEVENVFWDLGYRKSSDSKWRRPPEQAYVVIESTWANQPTVDVELYVRPESGDSEILKKIATSALRKHFSRRMELDEVKLLDAVY